MDVIELYRSDDMLVFEMYYNSSGRLDRLITIQRTGSVVYRTNAEIYNEKLYRKNRDKSPRFFMGRKSFIHRKEMEA